MRVKQGVVLCFPCTDHRKLNILFPSEMKRLKSWSHLETSYETPFIDQMRRLIWKTLFSLGLQQLVAIIPTATTPAAGLLIHLIIFIRSFVEINFLKRDPFLAFNNENLSAIRKCRYFKLSGIFFLQDYHSNSLSFHPVFILCHFIFPNFFLVFSYNRISIWCIIVWKVSVEISYVRTVLTPCLNEVWLEKRWCKWNFICDSYFVVLFRLFLAISHP